MSEQDRMERAERIRQMREGRRADEDADGPEETDADVPTTESEGDEDTDVPASDAEDDTAPQEQPDEDQSEAMTHVDDTVADAVERVAGASASVPDPEEMAESAGEQASAASPSVDGPDPGQEGSTETQEGPAPAEDSPLPGADQEEGAADVGAAARAGIAAETASAEPETRVLEFTLDGERFCLDIDYIEEIVKRDGITRVPNTPAFIEGVVDLRGQITTILNPKVVIETEDQSRGELLVVLDGEEFDEQGHLGWVVDDVRQVSPVSDADVNDPPVDGDHIEGVIDRGDDEEFVVWTSPELALDEAT